MIFEPDYGLIADTFASLILQFNPNAAEAVSSSTGLGPEGIQWIQDNCPAPDEALEIFFKLTPRQPQAFLQSCFSDRRPFLLPRTFENFLQTIFSAPNLSEQLYTFFLPDQPYPPDLTDQLTAIQASDLDFSIKFHLLGFLIHPEEEIRSVKRLLMGRRAHIESFHQQRSDLCETLHAEITEENLHHVDRALYRLDAKYRRIYYSISLLCDYSIDRCRLRVEDDSDDVFYNIGLHWKEAALLETKNSSVDLVHLGKIFSEKHRCEIIEYLFEHNTITVAETIAYLKISLTAANYHLNAMADAGLLASYSEGRKLFFYIDPTYLEKASLMFRKMAEQYAAGHTRSV